MQTAHSTVEACRHFLDKEAIHPHFVVLEVNDESHLRRVIDKLNLFNIRHKAFIEPDLGNQITSVATEPISGESRKIFKNYSLLK